MTRDEKIDSLCKWCITHACDPIQCRIFYLCQQCPTSKAWKDMPDDIVDKAMKDLTGTDNPREAAKQILFGTDSSSFPSQKAKADYGKEELTLVPRRIIHDICAIRMYGNQKYPEGGPDNWKQVEIERYRNAAYRHFLAYLDEPQGKDKESGFPHLWHLACNIAFLCEMEATE